MANVKLLKEKIYDSGMTIVAIAKKSGIERATLYKKITDDEEKRTEFTATEIVNLSNVLRLTKAERDKIFLSSNVN